MKPKSPPAEQVAKEQAEAEPESPKETTAGYRERIAEQEDEIAAAEEATQQIEEATVEVEATPKPKVAEKAEKTVEPELLARPVAEVRLDLEGVEGEIQAVKDYAAEEGQEPDAQQLASLEEERDVLKTELEKAEEAEEYEGEEQAEPKPKVAEAASTPEVVLPKTQKGINQALKKAGLSKEAIEQYNNMLASAQPDYDVGL